MYGRLFKKRPAPKRHIHIKNSQPPQKSSLNIEFYNIRSLLPKFDLVKTHLSSGAEVDIMFLTESWLSSNISDSMISITDYSLLRHDRSYGKGGGVSVYYKQHLKVVEVLPNNAFLTKHGAYLSNFEFLCIDFLDKLPVRFTVEPRLSARVGTKFLGMRADNRFWRIIEVIENLMYF